MPFRRGHPSGHTEMKSDEELAAAFKIFHLPLVNVFLSFLNQSVRLWRLRKITIAPDSLAIYFVS